VILVHNHPSGDPTPSAEDRAVTRQITEAGRAIGIRVLDHVVIADRGWERVGG
jgi:DNA repair protein RadC